MNQKSISDDEKDDENILKLEHKQSSTFISDFATGAIITGPSLEKLYFLTFFSDAVAIKHEKGRIKSSSIQQDYHNKNTIYELSMQEAEVESFREDKARITLSRETLISLRELLNSLTL